MKRINQLGTAAATGAEAAPTGPQPHAPLSKSHRSVLSSMDAVYPAAASALSRGRRRRRAAPRPRRHLTAPVTFAEIKEVDEDKEETEEGSRASTASVASVASAAEERRRRPDVLDEGLDREFAAFRRRRARRQPLCECEPDEQPEPEPEASGPAAPDRVTAAPRPPDHSLN